MWSLFFRPIFAIMCLLYELIFLWYKKKQVSRVRKKISYQCNVSFDVWIKECWNLNLLFFFTQYISMQCFLWRWKNIWLKNFIKECRNRPFLCLPLLVFACLSLHVLKAGDLLGERVSGWAFNLGKFPEITQHQFLTEAYEFILSSQN